jgi:predicted nucleic acid-binding Zn finger protein
LLNENDLAFWIAVDHNNPEQLRRQRSACDKRVSFKIIDSEKEIGIATGTRNREYTVTLGQCSCMDYLYRRLPCKHMYKLAYELGEFDLFRSDTELQ